MWQGKTHGKAPWFVSLWQATGSPSFVAVRNTSRLVCSKTLWNLSAKPDMAPDEKTCSTTLLM